MPACYSGRGKAPADASRTYTTEELKLMEQCRSQQHKIDLAVALSEQKDLRILSAAARRRQAILLDVPARVFEVADGIMQQVAVCVDRVISGQMAVSNDLRVFSAGVDLVLGVHLAMRGDFCKQLVMQWDSAKASAHTSGDCFNASIRHEINVSEVQGAYVAVHNRPGYGLGLPVEESVELNELSGHAATAGGFHLSGDCFYDEFSRLLYRGVGAACYWKAPAGAPHP